MNRLKLHMIFVYFSFPGRDSDEKMEKNMDFRDKIMGIINLPFSANHV